MDGGFGEAALMGALVGGGASLLTGKNPLTGALLGGVTGGAMSGISGALAGTADTAVKDQIIQGAIENAGVNSGVVDQGILNAGLNPGAAFTSGAASPGISSGLSSGLSSGIGASTTSELANAGLTGLGETANAGLTGLGGMQNVGLTQGAGLDTTFADKFGTGAISTPNQQLLGAFNPAQAANTAATNQVAATAAKQAASKGMLGGIKDWYGGLSMPEKIGVGIAGSVGLNEIMKPPKLLNPNIGKSNYSGPKLHDLSPDFQPLVVSQPTPYYTAHYAEGGIAALAGGGDATNFMGGGMYPQSQQEHSFYATPTQMPTSAQQSMASYEPNTNPLTGEMTAHMASGGIAGYADGGSTATAPVYTPSYSNVSQEVNPSSSFSLSDSLGLLGATNPGVVAQYLGGIPGVSVSQPYNRITGMPSPDQMAASYAPAYSMPTNNPAMASALPGPVQNTQTGAPTAAPTAQPVQTPSASSQMPPFPVMGTPADKTAWNNTYAIPRGITPGSNEWSQLTGVPAYAHGGSVGYASGGIAGYSLGGYAAGGNPRLLKGPGDGMSDNIPAVIGHKQPARLADGEFVVPADVVSHLGNGSTDAGAKQLYAMMDKVRTARTGVKKQGKQIKPEKYLPA